MKNIRAYIEDLQEIALFTVTTVTEAKRREYETLGIVGTTLLHLGRIE